MKQKIILSIAILSLLSLAVFVSADYVFNPDMISCPEDCKEVNGHLIPNIVSDLPTNNLNEFLSHSSFSLGTDIFAGENFLGDWWNYEPMGNKVNELIGGKNTQYARAESILKWVKQSKSFCTSELESQGICISKANNRESYENIFNSGYGVCLDNTLVAVTMLRKAGIPALAMHISFNHIDVLLKADDKWYVYDPIPCSDKNVECINREKLTPLGSDRILAWYHDSKAVEIDSSGLYCDMSEDCYSTPRFAWLKYLFFGDDFIEVFVPNKDHFEYLNEGKTNRYDCTFSAGDLICDNYGCGYFNGVSDSIGDVNQWKLLYIYGKYFSDDGSVYGYAYSRIPSDRYYKYQCSLVVQDSEPKNDVVSLNYFFPKIGEKIIITPDSLEKAPGISDELFNDLKLQILDSVEGIDLNEYLVDNNNDYVEGSVSIKKGWNLIYGLQSPDQLSGGNIEPKNIKAIYALNPKTQNYVLLYPENLKNNEIKPFLSYSSFWVYSDKSGRTEYEFEQPLPLDKVALFKGWNFIGITPDFEDKNLNELKGSCDIEKVYAFQEGSWYSLIDSMNDKIFDSDEIKMQGLVIKVSNDYCFLGESSPPELPEDELEPLPTLPNGEEKCTDSDGGKDIYTKGTIRGISLTSQLTTETDYCIEGNLIEFFCNDETNNIQPQNRINNEGMPCPSGYVCDDGACVTQ